MTESLFDERVVDRHRTVLVTGGTGYIGRNLVTALLKRGFILNVLVRENSNLSGLEGCNFFLGDLTDPDSLRPALQNCSFVFHLAAKVAPWSRDPAVFDGVNVRGHENLLRLCQEAGVRKVLHTSSFVVFGPSNGRVHTEGSRYNAHPFGDYDRTAILADHLTQQYRDKGLAVLSLYPTVVYGPGERTGSSLAARLLGRYARGRLPGLIAGGHQKWNFVHVDDVVAGHLAAMRRGAGGRYVLGGENSSLRDFFKIAAKLLDRRPPRLAIPPKLARLSAAVEELRARWSNHEPVVTRPLVGIIAAHWAFSSERAESDLGYRPRPLLVGLKESVDWILQQR
ncbi:MAG: NAD-dependent epimerase/dehydratase family protein [Acidobacteria bacterium]|nr:NAD-dependent epimerase/dehydratase family protein [Acidobacteriota bacterium]